MIPLPAPLVALSGFGGCGKDAAAAGLVARGWRRQAFADKVRDFALAIDPILYVEGDRPERLAAFVERVGWDTAKRSEPEVRHLLQRIGTEGGRKVLGDNVWADAVLRTIDGPTVISDCRFRNEADAVKAAGGLVLRIERPGVGPVTGPDGTIHPSETALDGYPFDAIVRNRGSLEDLHRLLVMAIRWHGLTVAG